MPHLIEPIRNKSFDDALTSLRTAHDFVVSCAAIEIKKTGLNVSLWGIDSKRTEVNLQGDAVPALIGKEKEKLGEVINIAATVERLIAAIEWFKNQYPSYSILECHPSTSDDEAGNDLVLVNKYGEIKVRCEVCDVASTRAGANSKEQKDLCSLGCAEEVPDDGIKRYICTSREFATALTSERRAWAAKPYRYEQFSANDAADSRLLLIQSNR
jgi:hypothetical protein